MRASLNSKILVVVLSVVVAITAGLSALFYRAERSEVLADAYESARDVGRTTEGALTAAMKSRTTELVGQVVEGIEKSDEVLDVAVFDATGKPAFTTGFAPLGELGAETLGDRRPRGMVATGVDDPAYIVFTPVEISPVCFTCHEQSDPIAGVIRVDVSLRDDYDLLRGHRDRFVLQTVVMAGVLVLALWVMLSRTVVRPLKIFARRARQIAQGDLTQRVDFPQEDEIGDLAISFNAMTSELTGRIGDLEEARERLETSMHRVAEALSSALDIDSIMHVMIGEAIGVGRFAAGAVVLDDGTSFVVDPVSSPAGRGASSEGGVAPESRDVEKALRMISGLMTGVGAARVLYRSADVGFEAIGLPEQYETAVLLSMASEGALVGHLMLVAEGHVDLTQPDRRALEFLAVQGARAVVHTRLHELAREMAITDGLTGLFDHRHFYEALGSEVVRAARYGLSLSLVLLDVDDFKKYNDRVGHRGGDQVLRRLGEMLRDHARGTDFVARYGGEEFAAILPHTTHHEAVAFADRLRDIVQNEPFCEGEGQPGGRLTISLGVSTRPEHGGSAEELVEAADRALYLAKARGRNRTVSADEAGADMTAGGPGGPTDGT
ncbi:MAG: diguanylate cyclase [Actinobacteria bacterium]|nr:diguanylate cyclase [Actinomycetota bacterium]